MHETITNPVIKDEVTFVQSAVTTNGRITTLQVKLMPGGGTPMHFHKHFSESFIVIEGELTITTRETSTRLSAGGKITVQKNEWHRFSNESMLPVVFTTVIIPGSAGFENSLRILYGLAKDGKTNEKGMPSNPLVLAVVAKISDMHPAGPRFIISTSIAIMNLLAGISGLRRKLLRRYC
ncbi:cupin domain-containing protein [Chitinophaga sp. OAE865]|uniref:cupin domain-containing protein n=1 Tax=Chitinophaga sp. OAE865 TaxID=2817898 RepID=UPI001AE9B8A0